MRASVNSNNVSGYISFPDAHGEDVHIVIHKGYHPESIVRRIICFCLLGYSTHGLSTLAAND